MAVTGELPGSAGLELVSGVVPLDPASATYEAMLAGWARQQRARFLKDSGTIEPRLALVRRMTDFTVQVVDRQVPQTSTATAGGPPAVRRSVIRRPEGL